MDHTLTWDGQRGAVLRCTGPLSVSTLLRALEEMGANPLFDDLRYVLTDLSGVEYQPIDPGMVAEVAAHGVALAFTNDRTWNAIVVADPRMGMLAEMFISQSVMPHRWRVFFALEPAQRWLSSQSTSPRTAR